MLLIKTYYLVITFLEASIIPTERTYNYIMYKYHDYSTSQYLKECITFCM